MHIPEDITNWEELYQQEITVAEKELMSITLNTNPINLIGDVYVLPTSHHQTFYGILVKEYSLTRFHYVKAIENSVWFSELIYHYTIAEAKQFENHPKRNGRLITNSCFIDYSFLNKLINSVNLLAEHQPDYVVVPAKEATFTAIRLFDAGTTISNRICFTDTSRLAFKKSENSDATDFLNNLHSEFEKMIGIGE